MIVHAPVRVPLFCTCNGSSQQHAQDLLFGAWFGVYVECILVCMFLTNSRHGIQ